MEWYPSGGIPDGEKQPDGFIAILKAIGLADNQSINELCIRFGSRCGIPYLTVESLAQNSARFVNLQKGVAKLRRLDFRIGDETQGPEESYTQLFASGTCCQLLHAGQELRELVVHPGIRYPYPNILLEQVFGFQEETWPHLTKLYLSEVEVGVSDLTGFLRRHSSTLRHLSLGRIYLMDCRTSWAAIFNDMRDFLTLEGVSVGALLYRENHPCHVESRDKLKPELRRKLELYLLEGGQNPLLT